MKTKRIKVSNQIAVLIANTLNKDSSINVETTLAEMDFETEEVKELILQLCKFHADKKVCSRKRLYRYSSDGSFLR